MVIQGSEEATNKTKVNKITNRAQNRSLAKNIIIL